jgi:preprotein translocase subunit YajC
MPLLKGKENIGKNIKTEEEHGKPKKQAIAIALHTAGVPKAKDADDEETKRIQNRYSDLRGRSTQDLKSIMQRYHKIIDLREATKSTLCWDILRAEFGDKKIDAYLSSKSKDAVLPIGDDHEEEGFEHHASRPRQPLKPYDDVADVRPIPTDTKVALAKHNAGLTKSQDRRTRDAELNIGDKVHLGFGTKGGAGFEGVVTKIEGDTVYIKNNEGRTFKGPLKSVTKANDVDLVQPIRVDPVPTPSGEHNERGWFADGRDEMDDAQRLKNIKSTLVYLRKKYDACLQRGDRYGAQEKEKDIRTWLSEKESVERRIAQSKAKDVSALAPKAEQFENGARVHNSRGSVGEVVHVQGNKVIVAVGGRREEWPLAKTFRAAGAEDSSENESYASEELIEVEEYYTKISKDPKATAKQKSDALNDFKAAQAAWRRAKAQAGAEDVLPIGEDATNPNPNPRVLTSFAAPSKEDVQRIYGKKTTPEGFKKQFGKDAAPPPKGTYLEFEKKPGQFFKITAKTNAQYDAQYDAAVKKAGLYKKGEEYPWFTVYIDGEESGGGGGRNSGEMKDGYAETYAAARKKTGQVRPIPLGPAPEPEALKEVERRAQDDVITPKQKAVVDKVYAMLREAHIPTREIRRTTVEQTVMEGHTAKEIFTWIKQSFDDEQVNDSEVKPIRVNPAPMAKLIPRSKRPAKDTVPAGNALMRSGGKLEMDGKFKAALAEYKKALEAFKKERDKTGQRDAEQAIYEMERKAKHGEHFGAFDTHPVIEKYNAARQAESEAELKKNGSKWNEQHYPKKPTKDAVLPIPVGA